MNFSDSTKRGSGSLRLWDALGTGRFVCGAFVSAGLRDDAFRIFLGSVDRGGECKTSFHETPLSRKR